jgi:hypothetical protein
MSIEDLPSLSFISEFAQEPFFLSHFKFVGINVCADGNRPAQSKHTLLRTWPAPKTVCDVFKFIGFAQFYARFIHNFELRVAPLRNITKQEYTNPVAQYWSKAASILLMT